MAATSTLLSQPSLIQSKSFISFKTQQNPSLCLSNTLSLPSKSSYVGKKEHRIVAKWPMAVKQSILSSSIGPNSREMKNPIIVIDNYDSFTYNLCQYMGELGCYFEVYRNDELTVEELKRKNPRGVLISPGPGEPRDSGISLETVLELGPLVPLFGVCMGLQCIGEAFGGKIVRSPYGVMHGKSSPVYYDEKGEDGLFSGLSNPFTAGRYHSLVIENDSFPTEELEITAWTEDGLIMAARHKKYKHLQGVQFHPESIITSEGKTIVQNFIKLVERKEAESQN
ncbi:Anthranilate synthase component II, putative [Ricinus communis]|uniref:anthranilate synthase n=2 Tax=Ricinus communis TaxID=3988 RepID=B9SNH9_RICCO|nr:Anthranilate synthase component II, putative [Ricinus communis]